MNFMDNSLVFRDMDKDHLRLAASLFHRLLQAAPARGPSQDQTI